MRHNCTRLQSLILSWHSLRKKKLRSVGEKSINWPNCFKLARRRVARCTNFLYTHAMNCAEAVGKHPNRPGQWKEDRKKRRENTLLEKNIEWLWTEYELSVQRLACDAKRDQVSPKRLEELCYTELSGITPRGMQKIDQASPERLELKCLTCDEQHGLTKRVEQWETCRWTSKPAIRKPATTTKWYSRSNCQSANQWMNQSADHSVDPSLWITAVSNFSHMFPFAFSPTNSMHTHTRYSFIPLLQSWIQYQNTSTRKFPLLRGTATIWYKDNAR